MTYEESLAYLRGLQRFGMKPGLDRIRRLLNRLGRPDWRAGRIIHITGTSGKGSVAAMVESALRAAGYRTGLYTSPSLERFTERIQIDRQPIAESDLADLIAVVHPYIEEMVKEGLECPTEFEVTTAVAFLYFAHRQVDWLVLEAGLGGRFDATTVIDSPVITCITNVGLDHMEWLGATCEEIASDKAGIIKPAVPCVTGTEHLGALSVIRAAALSENAVLEEVGPGDYYVDAFGVDGQVVRLLGARGWYEGVRLSLLAHYQAENAAIAVRILELAGISESHIRSGLAEVDWPGRFELMQMPNDGPLVLLDGAHNPAKCTALVRSVRDYFPDRPITLVMGVLADTAVAEMVAPLLSEATQVWVTEPHSPRRLPALELQRICEALGTVTCMEPDLFAAVEAALCEVGRFGLVLVTGSFYVIGPVRQFLHERIASA